MTKKDAKYREGDDEEEKKAPPKEEKNPIPQTGFLVLKLSDGRVEVVADVGIEREHAPNHAEIRDMCRSAADSLQSTITANTVVGLFRRDMQQAMQQAQANDIRSKLRSGIVPIKGRQ